MADFVTSFEGASGTNLETLGWHVILYYGGAPSSYGYWLNGAGYIFGMHPGLSHDGQSYTDTEQTATVYRRDDLAENELCILSRQKPDLWKYGNIRAVISSTAIRLSQDYGTYGTYNRALAVGETETITLRSEGNQFSVYRNGELIIGPVTLTQYASGPACLGTWAGLWDKQKNGLQFGSYEFTDLSAPPVGPDVKTYTYAGGELTPVTVKLWQSDGTNWTQRNAKLWTSDGSAWADKGTI